MFYDFCKVFPTRRDFWLLINSSIFSDATNNGEAADLENRLRNLSSGLVGLRNCLHDQSEANMMLPPTFVGSNYFQGK